MVATDHPSTHSAFKLISKANRRIGLLHLRLWLAFRIEQLTGSELPNQHKTEMDRVPFMPIFT